MALYVYSCTIIDSRLKGLRAYTLDFCRMRSEMPILRCFLVESTEVCTYGTKYIIMELGAEDLCICLYMYVLVQE